MNRPKWTGGDQRSNGGSRDHTVADKCQIEAVEVKLIFAGGDRDLGIIMNIASLW